MGTFLGEILLVGFQFAPNGFQFCAGQLLPVATNTALFSLLGSVYGGDGTSTFALPDLRGRVAINQGQGPGLSSYTLGEVAGSETNTLVIPNLPPHTHGFHVNNAAGTTGVPSGNLFLSQGPVTGSGPNATVLKTYTSAAANATLNGATIGVTGSGDSFSVIQPFLIVNYIIALQGIFPSRN